MSQRNSHLSKYTLNLKNASKKKKNAEMYKIILDQTIKA